MTDKEREAKWQAESDAHTITQAEVIKADAKRLAAAEKAAKEMVDKQMVEASAMKMLSKGHYGHESTKKELIKE